MSGTTEVLARSQELIGKTVEAAKSWGAENETEVLVVWEDSGTYSVRQDTPNLMRAHLFVKDGVVVDVIFC
jgi:hypothetical protein